MKCFVTGGAGFIGSNLVDRLLTEGHQVISYDNFSTGREEFLERAYPHPAFKMVPGDLLDGERLNRAVRESDFVFHLAANADIRFGTEHPRKDLEQNTIATFNLLEAMRLAGVKRIAFASTGSIYGEPEAFPTPENSPFPIQTSFYGASKLACEGLIQAYCEGFEFRSWIFRFVSILGERYTHGHVFDFYKSLRNNPSVLKVLGNGEQRKSYLYVQDCLDAILLAITKASARVNIFNLGTDAFCKVTDSIRWISTELKVNPTLEFSGGDRGWIGDSPFIFLDTQRIRALGWAPHLSIQEGVVRTLRYLQAQPWLLKVH